MNFLVPLISSHGDDEWFKKISLIPDHEKCMRAHSRKKIFPLYQDKRKENGAVLKGMESEFECMRKLPVRVSSRYQVLRDSQLENFRHFFGIGKFIVSGSCCCCI